MAHQDSLPIWQNWSGRHRVARGSLVHLRSVEDAAALVRQASEQGQNIRIAGAGHSHQPLVVNEEGIIADVSGLAGITSIDKARQQAWIRAGSSIFSLGAALHAEGLALKNQGDIDRQLLGGAVATGTHGTGMRLQNISAAVIGLKIITAAGKHKVCNAEQNSDLFQAARLSLGALGIITELQMQLRQACVLKEEGFNTSYAEIRPRLMELAEAYERFEFFWFPKADRATVKIINTTAAPPVYPLAEEGARQAWSHEVLPSHRPHPHTEMEYSLPLEAGPACLDEIVNLLRNEFPEVFWPVEYRTVAADDIWLSMAFGRPTVTISIHQDVNQDETAFYRAAEGIFRQHGGRPHWGKVNYLTAADLASSYPHWQDWWRVRNTYDPDGIFLNDYLRAISTSTAKP